MKTKNEIISIAQDCIDELNKKYDKHSNYQIYNEDGIVGYKTGILNYQKKYADCQDMMAELQQKNDWSTSIMYYAIGEMSRCANCASLCNLLLPLLFKKALSSSKCNSG